MRIMLAAAAAIYISMYCCVVREDHRVINQKGFLDSHNQKSPTWKLFKYYISSTCTYINKINTGITIDMMNGHNSTLFVH